MPRVSSMVLKDVLLMHNVNRGDVREKMLKNVHVVDLRICNGSEGLEQLKVRRVDLHVFSRTHNVSKDVVRMKAMRNALDAF